MEDDTRFHMRFMSFGMFLLGVAIGLCFLVGCVSVETGGRISDNGWAVEVTALTAKHIGLRGSIGQEKLPVEWAEWGSKANRYALGPVWQIPVYKGFYVEPRLDIAYYPTLGTEWELEAAGRVGWKHDWFGVYVGARHPLGNGDRHEDIGRYSHIPDGWKLEAGFNLTWRW
jgi:hypothetical protein